MAWCWHLRILSAGLTYSIIYIYFPHTTSFVTIGLGAATTSKMTQTWVNFFSLVATIILLSTINDFKCRTTQTSIILTIVVAISIVHVIIVAIVDVITNVTVSVVLTVVVAMILMTSGKKVSHGSMHLSHIAPYRLWRCLYLGVVSL